LDGGQRDAHVHAGRSGYHYGIYVWEHWAQRRIASGGFVGLGQILQAVFSAVHEHDFCDAFRRLQDPSMLGPPIAASDQCDAESISLRGSAHVSAFPENTDLSVCKKLRIQGSGYSPT
jgi:hypothetical protein